MCIDSVRDLDGELWDLLVFKTWIRGSIETWTGYATGYGGSVEKEADMVSTRSACAMS
jgi:hypothetical protein